MGAAAMEGTAHTNRNRLCVRRSNQDAFFFCFLAPIAFLPFVKVQSRNCYKALATRTKTFGEPSTRQQKCTTNKSQLCSRTKYDQRPKPAQRRRRSVSLANISACFEICFKMKRLRTNLSFTSACALNTDFSCRMPSSFLPLPLPSLVNGRQLQPVSSRTRALKVLVSRPLSLSGPLTVASHTPVSQSEPKLNQQTPTMPKNHRPRWFPLAEAGFFFSFLHLL